MENTKTSMFKRIADFFRSFVSSDIASNGRVTEEYLSREEQKELAKVLKESGETVQKIEDSIKGRYKVEVDTRKAKVAASKNKGKE